MGQTLTHGVYLPDEGERNCYAGLAANWSLLDGAVGTVAEHSTQIAGKAPAVHTHTKADITDLLNSNFIPSANNSYDLGSSSYQWNNLYAKNYFYNGVAWGLDKANVWSAWQTQEHATEPLIRLRRSNLQIGDPIPASQQIIGTIPFADKNNLNLGLIACRDNTTGDTYLTLITRQRYDSNGRANNGTQYESRIDLGIDSSQNLYLRPNSNGQINLGTSTNKWKTLNGINPGALSLPTTDTTKIADFSSDITDLTGGLNTKTFALDGWITIITPNVSGDSIAIDNSVGLTVCISAPGTGDPNIAAICPVRAGIPNKIYVKCSGGSLVAAYTWCQGNV